VSRDPNLVKKYVLDPDQIWIWNLTSYFEFKNNFKNPVIADSIYVEKIRANKYQPLNLRQVKLNQTTKIIEFGHEKQSCGHTMFNYSHRFSPPATLGAIPNYLYTHLRWVISWGHNLVLKAIIYVEYPKIGQR
jgi:hypothetical protein